jgi:predicted nucleotidyltransferase
MSSSPKTVFIQERENLLAEITESLRHDERFVAAWLAGSFERGQQSGISDLDLFVVVTDAHSEHLCTTPWPSGARTTHERLTLFKQFGTPGVIYEDQAEAPEGGTITTVLYTSAMKVRWILLPLSTAQRPSQSHLLFEKNTIPLEPPALPASRQERLEEAAVHLAFFWLMAPITFKHLIRHDVVFFDLHLPLEDAERLVTGALPPQRSGWGIELYHTREERVEYLLSLCQRAQQLSAQILELGGQVAESTLPIIELWVEMVQDVQRRKQYAADREDLLARIVSTLQADERFVAAWLEGSYVHGTKDDLSDIDLRIVVADTASALSEVPWTAPSFHTTPERHRFFSQFGEPLVTWDTQTFASIAEQGSFTLTYYKTIGVHVDWVLIPRDKAERPVKSIVLFDKVGIVLKPEASPEAKGSRLQQLSDHIGLFWTLAADCWQYLANHGHAYYHMLVERLQNLLGQLRETVDGIPWIYMHTRLYATQEEQVAALRRLCDEMEQLMPAVVEMGGSVPPNPRAVVEKRLELLAVE